LDRLNRVKLVCNSATVEIFWRRRVSLKAHLAVFTYARERTFAHTDNCP